VADLNCGTLHSLGHTFDYLAIEYAGHNVFATQLVRPNATCYSVRRRLFHVFVYLTGAHI
jgi:hypothetical protein